MAKQEKTVTVDGKKLHAETCKADEWFDALEMENKREQDYHIISICIRDEKGNPVYEPKDVGDLPITTYAKLYGMALRANRPADPGKN